MIQNTAELISKQDGLTLSVLWTEPEKKVRGVVQISHGMSEHKERYLPFMKFLAGHGYAAVIHDHRGHGGSVREKEDLGYFYNTKEKGIIEDLHQVTRWAKDRFAGLPFYMLGHSMGTLVARNYLKQYDEELDKLVLTGPPSKKPAVDAGLWLAKVQKKLRGGSYRSKEIQLLAFGPFASRFRKEGSPSAWICSDEKVVEAYDQSPLCGFVFTADGFESLFHLMKSAYSKKGWNVRNQKLPILFLGGEEDPCIGNGRKFVQELQFLKAVGYQKVTGKRYPGMRHEILNEQGKEEVFRNILQYLEK